MANETPSELSSEMKVGALFFIGLGLVSSFVFFFSNPFKGKGEYKVRFARVVRLQAGDPVTYNGVKIGSVSRVEPVLDKDEQGHDVAVVQVDYTIDGSLKKMVLIDATSVFKIDQGLLGGSALAIVSVGGTPIKATSEKTPPPRGIEPVAIDETMASIRSLVEENRVEIKATIASAHQTVEHVGEMSEQVRDLVKENRAQVQTMIGRISDMAGNIGELVKKNSDSLGQAITNIKDLAKQLNDVVGENREQIRKAIEKLGIAGENVGAAAKTINETVSENRESIKKTMDGLAKVGPRLDKISENLELVTGQIASGKGTLGKLVFEDTLHEKAVLAADNFNQRMEEIKPITSGFTTLKFIGGIEAGINTESGVTDTYAYLRIEPRPWKFYQGGISYRTAPPARNAVREDPDKFHVDFNLLIGWRFFPDDSDQLYRLTIAGGLIDSQVGGWVSVPLLGEWLDLKVMCRAKDNQRDITARRYEEGSALLRATLEAHVWRRVSFVVGGDDLIDKPGLWCGIRGELLDNDLRNIVTVAGLGK